MCYRPGKQVHFVNRFEDGTKKEKEWATPQILSDLSLKLTIARLKRFNQLVRDTNAVIQKAVDEISNDPSIRYKIETSDWNEWPKEGVLLNRW